MPFTPITITGGPFTRADTDAAEGRLTAILSEQMANGASVVNPTPIYGILNSAGMLKDDSGVDALQLEANDDVGTTPSAPTASYAFVLELDGAMVHAFEAVVPSAAVGGTIDLSELMGS